MNALRCVVVGGLLVVQAGAFAQSLFVPGGPSGVGSSSQPDRVGVATSNPRATLDLVGNFAQTNAGSNHFYNSQGNEYWRIYPAYSNGTFYITRGAQNPAGGALDLFKFNGDATFEALHGDIIAGADRKLVARYNGSDQYRGTFGWSHLQLGNNGPNWIAAGRTSAGGSLTFVVNNTTDYAYGQFNGLSAMHIAANGSVGVGTVTPMARLHVDGGEVRLPGAGGGLTHFNYGDGKNYIRGSTVIADSGGNVGIGTTNPSHKLAVNGTIKAKEVIVETTGWADDVFAPDYALPSLDAVAQHIAEKGHLPGIPSAAEVAEQGVAVGDMQVALLRKVEELTLYMLETRSELERTKAENAELRRRLESLEVAR